MICGHNPIRKDTFCGFFTAFLCMHVLNNMSYYLILSNRMHHSRCIWRIYLMSNSTIWLAQPIIARPILQETMWFSCDHLSQMFIFFLHSDGVIFRRHTSTDPTRAWAKCFDLNYAACLKAYQPWVCLACPSEFPMLLVWSEIFFFFLESFGIQFAQKKHVGLWWMR